MNFLKYLKYLPIALEAIKNVEKLVELVTDRFRKKTVMTTAEEQTITDEIDEQAENVADIIYSLLPESVKLTIEIKELRNFISQIDDFILCMIAMIEATLPLFQKNEDLSTESK